MLGHNMDRMPNFAFRSMTGIFKVMHFFVSFEKRLETFGIQKGFTVVDYGCGPGMYLRKASELAGENGRVYAVDIHELALQEVEKLKIKHNLQNVITVSSSQSKQQIPTDSVDLIYALDMFHMVSDKQTLLEEFNRMLAKNGTLILEDGHNPRRVTEEAVMLHGKWKVLQQANRYMMLKPN